ncbi:T9SS type A sorting domain-containing protein [uncultured Psychroserpens sp.]|uniref:T9SS type A sorting domain-containing protein n=1 Tax=uncultured Psychroserpens sp. TaxID=255436 RepID=UPI0026225D67|nr:T9SS type A sorting domain-containing protein [uncultured Psychroserpens sp.]
MKNVFFFLIVLISGVASHGQIVSIPDTNFKNQLLNYTPSIDTNGDDEIQISEAEAVASLEVSNISSIVGLESFINLIDLKITYSHFTSGLTIQNLPNLEIFDLTYVGLPSLSMVNLPSLKEFELGYLTEGSTINTVDFDSCNCPDMERVFLNQAFYITTLDISDFINLKYLGIEIADNFTELDISNNINLETIFLYNTGISQLNFSQNSNIKNINLFYHIGILEMDLTNCPNLERVEAEEVNFSELDLSNSPNLNILYLQSVYTSVLNIKNGTTAEASYMYFLYADYICADDNELDAIVAEFDPQTNNNPVINSYCSFTPGGSFYTIGGENKLDANSDGCDSNDNLYPSLKFNISDGTNTGTYISNPSGNYSIPLSEGMHTLTPVIENPTYFSTPSPLTVSFPSEMSPFNQDFCITPNGVHNDLEVFIVPLTEAIPGFDATYKVVYKNVGNTLVSGSVDFDYSFDRDYMEYVSSLPSEMSHTNNVLSWNYTDLSPFESREIVVTFTLNTPTDIDFPLNLDDELNFEAFIYPITGDETPDNNDFGLKQIVVNSFDPNDIRCLEGEFILPERVGEYVHYLIRFENLGTANATNIVVKDNIDPAKFDINTLVPLDGSHAYYTRINESNIVEFIFENINLPFDDANNDGYVLFKIKTLESLVLGDQFSNQAEIYFDFNAPIITNNYTTDVAEENLSIPDHQVMAISMFPNPVNDLLNIESTEVLNTAVIYDLNGRTVLNVVLNTNQTRLDLSQLTEGVYFLKVNSSTKTRTLKLIKS